MQHYPAISRALSALIISALLLRPAPAAWAQQPPAIITANGTFTDSYMTWTLTFPPAGGPVTGSGNYHGPLVHWKTEDLWTCPGAATLSMTGTFDGGDGGRVGGTYSWEVQSDDPADQPTCGLHMTLEGNWSGTLRANGTGSGTFDFGSVSGGGSSMNTTGASEWQVEFDPADWQAALKPSPAITTEYIYNTYGITVEDSFGDGKYARKTWSDEELVLLNDVLKELPPSFRDKLALGSIVRSSVDIDQNGNPNPDVYGAYSPCERKAADQPCNPQKDSVIRIFDLTLTSGRFADDPKGYKSFKATLIHELTHAFQRNPDVAVNAADPLRRNASGYVSPLMQNYNDATRPITDMNDPGFRAGNGWGVRPDGSWVLNGAPGDGAPTDYAETNPKEDMADSVRLYVQDPQKLQAASAKRYNFIRDFIFGGVEYEDGHQK